MELRVICGIGLLLYGSPSAAFSQSPPSAFEFMSTSTFSQLEMSPSGRYSAMVNATTTQECLDGTGQVSARDDCKAESKQYVPSYKIVIYDLEKREPVKILPMPDNFYVGWLTWANEDRLLAAIARRTTTNLRGTRFSIGGSRIVSIHRESGDPITLFDDSTSMMRSNRFMSTVTNVLRNDKDHVIVPAVKEGDLDLWRVNIENGDYERIAVGRSGTFSWYTDENGKPILRFDANAYGTKIFVYAWSDESATWENIKTFKLRRSDEGEEDFDFYPVAPGDEPGQIYVLADEENDRRRSIKLFDFKTKQYVKTVFEHEKYDVGGAIIDYKTGKYAGAWYYADRLEQSFSDKKVQAHYRGLNKFFENDANVDFLGFDAAGVKSVVYVSSPDNPGEYYIYDTSEARIDPILARKPELLAAKFGKTEILNVDTRDGKNITAYLTSPAANGNDGPSPMIVMPHGGPEVRDYYDYDPWVQYFVTRGYQVLRVNFRGSSGFGREFAEAGYGEWGGVMQNDVSDAVIAVQKAGKADAASTCIVGFSYGGYVALYGAAATSELYHCVVAGAAASDLIASLGETKRAYGSDSETYEYWLKSIGDPKTDESKLAAASPIRRIDSIRIPVLLIHGKEDGIEDVNQSRRMYKALKDAGRDVEFLEMPYEGHNNWRLETEIMILEKIDAFLKARLQ